MSEVYKLPSGINICGYPTISRVIVATYIFSSDDKLLMGRKNPKKAGVYPDVWHIPGGGVKDGESLIEAALRETGEEAIGLHLAQKDLRELPIVAEGAGTKTLTSGEQVWCEMRFHHFEAKLGQTALELEQKLAAGDDLASLQWFDRVERSDLDLIPGGRDLMAIAGYIDVD